MGYRNGRDFPVHRKGDIQELRLSIGAVAYFNVQPIHAVGKGAVGRYVKVTLRVVEQRDSKVLGRERVAVEVDFLVIHTARACHGGVNAVLKVVSGCVTYTDAGSLVLKDAANNGLGGLQYGITGLASILLFNVAELYRGRFGILDKRVLKFGLIVHLVERGNGYGIGSVLIVTEAVKDRPGQTPVQGIGTGSRSPA